MKIKSILSALLLMVCTMASAQKYLNVKLEDGTYRSFKATPKMEISFDKTAKEEKESGNTILVNGYQVTVKLDEGQSELADDIVFTPNIKDGSKIKIEAISRSQKRLECYLDGNASCTKSSSNLVYYQRIGDPIIFISHIFTIQNITSDVTATIGYPRPAEIKLSESSRTAYVGGSYNLSATVLPDDTYNKKFTWSSSDNSVATVDENGKVTAEAVGTADIIATTEVGGITATCTVTVKPVEELFLPGEFSVGPAGSSKKVRFSRGNLYYDGFGFCIEEHQYDTKPTTNGHRDPNHISHFFWCKSASESVKEIYSETGTTSNDTFFTDNDDFAVNGVSSWRILTGDTGGEWKYLLETRIMTYGKPRYTKVFGVSIGGVTCKGLFIYPDDYSGNEVGVSGGPDTWADINAAGIVFLPATGYRNGDSSSDNPASVDYVGNNGYYWSASPYNNSNAYDLYFSNSYLFSSDCSFRNRAYSVRLVTEVK